MKSELINLARQVANKRQVPPDQVLAVISVYGDGQQLVSPSNVDAATHIEALSRETGIARRRIESLLLKLGENDQIPNLHYLERYREWAMGLKFADVREHHRFIYCCSLGLGLIPVKDILMPEMMFYPAKHLKYLRQYVRDARSQIEKVCDIVEKCYVRTSMIESMNNVAAYKRGIRDNVSSILPETYLLVNRARGATKEIEEQLLGVVIDESNMDGTEEQY